MSWQKWVGALAPWVIGAVGAVLGVLNVTPGWWVAVSGALLGIIQRIIAGV